MPTYVNAHPWIAKAVQDAGGTMVRAGSKPWAEFNGPDAAVRAKAVETIFEQVHGYACTGLRPWREDQRFDYTIRLD